ncbi:MAG: hypothetical protein IH627_19765 [Rubrivivax sp.]|nr:hypothetical protein [Rubrivivax sp.]
MHKLEGSDDARNEEIRLAQGLPARDVVMSGIPFSTLPASTAQRVAAAIARRLATGGRFVACQVRGHVAGHATPFRGASEVSWGLFNVPPVRVFRWLEPVEGAAPATAKAARGATAPQRSA